MMNSSDIINRPSYQGVDYMKFIMALCVVAIHVNSANCVLTHWPPCIKWLINLAVPFFFVCSGFLLARKLDRQPDDVQRRKTLWKRAFTIFRIFGCWLLIYLPITVYLDARNGDSVAHDAVAYFGRVLLSGESEYAYPLWFLYSMAIVLTVYAVLYKIKHIERILFALFAIVLAVNSLQSWDCLQDISLLKPFNLLTHRTLGGGTYIMAGIILYRMRFVPSLWLSLGLVVVSVSLFILKLPYWELCGGVALFALAVRINSSEASPRTWWRLMSMWIYYLHMYVIFFLSLYFGAKGEFLTAPVLYCIVLALAVVLSALLVRLQAIKSCSWLNFLIS